MASRKLRVVQNGFFEVNEGVQCVSTISSNADSALLTEHANGGHLGADGIFSKLLEEI